MASDAQSIIKILLQLQADTADLSKVKAALDEVQAQAASTGASVNAATTGATDWNRIAQERASATAALNSEEAANAESQALAQARIAAQMERRVIMETQLEAAEARIAGSTALAARLEREVDIRLRSLTVQRSLNISTEESIALAERLVLAEEAQAVAVNKTGINLSKAKTEAIVLAREIGTGNVRASTMSSLLGSMGTGLTIAGIAAFELYQGFKSAAEASDQIAKNVEKLSAEVQKASTNFSGLAKSVRTLADEVKMADKVQTELDRMAVEMADFRNKELTFWQKFWDVVTHGQGGGFGANLVNLRAGKITPTGPGTQDDTYEAELERQKAVATEEYNRALQNLGINLIGASRTVDTFTKALAAPAQNLPEYQKKLTAAENEFAAAKARLTSDPGNRAFIDQFTAAQHAVETAKDDVDKLTEAAKKHGSAQKEVTATLRDQANLLAQIRGQQQIIQQNPFLTDEQKIAQLTPLITQEIAAMNAQIGRDKALIAGGALDPGQYTQVIGKIQQAEREVVILGQKLKTLTFTGGLQANLVAWVNQFGTTAKQVANIITSTLNTAISSTSQALTNLIFKTGNWKDAFAQAAQSIVQNIIQIGLQMLVSKVLGSIITGSTVSEQTAAGSAIAAANAPAAAATSIASYGSSAVAGSAAAAAAISAIVGSLTTGFEIGGYTGGREGQVAGIVHGGEYVFPAHAVRALGVNYLGSLHSGVRRAGSYERGGFVGSASGPSGSSRRPEIHIFHFTDAKQLFEAYRNSSASEKHIVETMKRNKHEIGVL